MSKKTPGRWMHSLRGNTQKAIESFHRCLRIYRVNGLWDKVILALLNIAKALADRGDTEEALKYNRTALETARKRFDTAREAAALTNLGEIHLANDDLDAAEDACAEALSLFEEACDYVREADTLRVLACIAARSLDTERARSLYRSAIDKSREAGFRLGEAQSLRDYGELLDQMDPNGAASARREARDLFVGLGIQDEADRLDSTLRNQITARYSRAGWFAGLSEPALRQPPPKSFPDKPGVSASQT